MPPTITVDLNKKCAECGKKGACDNTLCLRCNARSMVPERLMKSEAGRAVQARWERIRGDRLPALEAAQPARIGGVEA